MQTWEKYPQHTENDLIPGVSIIKAFNSRALTIEYISSDTLGMCERR